MKILLDIDGVLETSPPWKKPQIENDNFYKFNDISRKNLIEIMNILNAEIVLTTTHRVNFSLSEWKEIFQNRGINIYKISKINDAKHFSELKSRNIEIEEWFQTSKEMDFLIIDDDNMLNQLSNTLKNRWIKIDPMLGITEEIKKLIILKANNIFDRS